MRKKQQAYLSILEEMTRVLQNGQMHLGDALPSDQELAKELSLSKGAVRDAIRDLERMGVIECSKEKTYCLRTSEELEKLVHLTMLAKEISPFEVAHMRLTMEQAALPLAFGRMDQLDLAEMRRHLEQMQYGNALESMEADKYAHMWLAEASGNQLLYHIMQAIWGICTTQMNLVLSDGVIELRQQQFGVHEKLYKSFLRDDIAMAQESLVQHYDAIETALHARVDKETVRVEFPEESVEKEPATERRILLGGAG
jgi:GntR family transcriptional repressor for pyruvate dehydrogenase complex